MKTLTLLLLLVFSATHLPAQQNDEKLFNLMKAEKYRRMKNTGAVLTVAGTILSIVGIVTISNSSYTTTTNGYGQTTSTATSGNPAGGALAFLAGSAAVGAGVPLWIVGAHAEKKYQRKLDGLAFRLNLNRRTAGVALVYRLRE